MADKNPRPWRLDGKWIEVLCDGFAKYTKAALDRELGAMKGEVATLTARVGQLETDLAAAVARIDKEWVEPQ